MCKLMPCIKIRDDIAMKDSTSDLSMFVHPFGYCAIQTQVFLCICVAMYKINITSTLIMLIVTWATLKSVPCDSVGCQ